MVCYVKDIKKTATFYEKLGFAFDKRTADHLSIYLNWFWMDFHPQDKEDKADFKKEANLKNYGHLYVVGFAIQPGASRLLQASEEMIGLPATYVQATMDLLMGDLLKTTRASQIFSVTGSPDVRLVRLKRKNGNGPLYRVELLGLDVFDPVSMQTDHRKGDDVPAWLLDTDYDDLVFHVSQAFFPRTSAWDALKRALRATFEDSVWEHLAGTVSEPFGAGQNRKVAVKVIDDRGNELMVVQGLDEAEPER